MAQEAGKYYLLANFSGYGNQGDVVEIVRKSGELCVVKNGDKQFCIENKYLSICQVHPLRVLRTSQFLTA